VKADNELTLDEVRAEITRLHKVKRETYYRSEAYRAGVRIDELKRLRRKLRQEAKAINPAENPDVTLCRTVTDAVEIPPDPDGQNGDRADWAGAAIEEFRGQTGTDEEDAVCDLIADLHHWADRHGMNWEDEVKRGDGHYWAETQKEGGW